MKSPERKQFLMDVFTTAMEGGIGYWAIASKYHWRMDDEDGRTVSDLDGFHAIVEDAEASYGGDIDMEPEFPKSRIDQSIIVKGICRIINGCVKDKKGNTKMLKISENIREAICKASGENDAGMIDAGDADCIVQVGLFGEIVFG